MYGCLKFKWGDPGNSLFHIQQLLSVSPTHLLTQSAEIKDNHSTIQHTLYSDDMQQYGDCKAQFPLTYKSRVSSSCHPLMRHISLKQWQHRGPEVVPVATKVAEEEPRKKGNKNEADKEQEIV